MQDKKEWELSIGLYPGILLGFRTYKEENQVTHVLDISLTIYRY